MSNHTNLPAFGKWEKIIDIHPYLNGCREFLVYGELTTGINAGKGIGDIRIAPISAQDYLKIDRIKKPESLEIWLDSTEVIHATHWMFLPPKP